MKYFRLIELIVGSPSICSLRVKAVTFSCMQRLKDQH